MNCTTGWEADLAKGKAGESFAKDLLESMGCTVNDLSGEAFYQNIDVDLEGIDHTGVSALIEVKSQQVSKYGNLLFEDYNHRASGNRFQGWFHKCKADYLMFVEPSTSKAYLMHWNDDVRKQIADLNYKITFNNKSDGGHSCLYQISLRTAFSRGWIKHSWNHQELFLSNPYLF